MESIMNSSSAYIMCSTANTLVLIFWNKVTGVQLEYHGFLSAPADLSMWLGFTGYLIKSLIAPALMEEFETLFIPSLMFHN